MAQLVVKQGPAAGRSYPLEGEKITIGRDSANDVWVPDDTVSRSHAELRLQDGSWTVTDLQSSNGTRLNSEPIERAQIRHMDEIQFGDAVLLFMDQIMVEVGHIPGVKIGDEVVLIGTQGEENISVEELAEKIATVPHEIVSRLGKRIPRVYKKE